MNGDSPEQLTFTYGHVQSAPANGTFRANEIVACIHKLIVDAHMKEAVDILYVPVPLKSGEQSVVYMLPFNISTAAPVLEMLYVLKLSDCIQQAIFTQANWEGKERAVLGYNGVEPVKGDHLYLVSICTLLSNALGGAVALELSLLEMMKSCAGDGAKDLFELKQYRKGTAKNNGNQRVTDLPQDMQTTYNKKMTMKTDWGKLFNQHCGGLVFTLKEEKDVVLRFESKSTFDSWFNQLRQKHRSAKRPADGASSGFHRKPFRTDALVNALQNRGTKKSQKK